MGTGGGHNKYCSELVSKQGYTSAGDSITSTFTLNGMPTTGNSFDVQVCPYKTVDGKRIYVGRPVSTTVGTGGGGGGGGGMPAATKIKFMAPPSISNGACV